MATNTNNYGFKKPEENDFYSIEDQNRNWDLADTKMAQLNSDLAGKVSTGSNPTLVGIELSNSTPYIDFHYGCSTADYTSRIIENSSGTLTVSGGLTVGGVLTASGVNVITAINERIKIVQRAITFSSGSATITVDGSSVYYGAMAQILSNNEYVVTQVKHDYGSNNVTIFVRNCAAGAALTGTLTLIILLLK